MPVISRPSPLRLVGFLCAIGGAAAMALGSLMTWATVVLNAAPGQPPNDSLDSQFKGVDTWEGIAVLVSGVLVIALIMFTRIVRGDGTARVLAILGVVVAIAGTIVAGVTLARVETRYQDEGLNALAGGISKQTGLPEAEVKRRLAQQQDKLADLQSGPGLSVAIAGGILATIGCILVAIWTKRRGRDHGAERPAEAPAGLPTDSSGDDVQAGSPGVNAEDPP